MHEKLLLLLSVVHLHLLSIGEHESGKNVLRECGLRWQGRGGVGHF